MRDAAELARLRSEIEQVVSPLVERLRIDYGLAGTGFITVSWADGRSITECAWCRHTPEQGHDEDCCWPDIKDIHSSLNSLAALARGGEPADDKCQLNRSGNWCLTHSCYPQTCSKLKEKT